MIDLAADNEAATENAGVNVSPGGKRRPRRLALLVAGLALLAGLWLGLTLRDAWRGTRRREAYLPELEAMARRSPGDGRLLALLGGGSWRRASTPPPRRRSGAP